MSENVRYKITVNCFRTVLTAQRQACSVSSAELRSSKSFFYTDQTRATIPDEQVEFFDEVTEPGSGFKVIPVLNRYDFKTPLNAAIADSDNERRFINGLLQADNVMRYDAWIKSTSMRFYEIDYAWKKGEHPKRGKFSPDFFIKAGDLIVVVEIKGDEELREPSEENRKKNEYALSHFARVNAYLEEMKSATRYKFMFLTGQNFNKFFKSLRDGTLAFFRSELDVKLSEEE